MGNIKLTLSLGNIIAIFSLMISLGIGYGSYKTAFENTKEIQASHSQELKELREEITKLRVATSALKSEMELVRKKL